MQDSAKEWFLGCVNSIPVARGSQEAGFTQPRDPSFAQPCTDRTVELDFRRKLYYWPPRRNIFLKHRGVSLQDTAPFCDFWERFAVLAVPISSFVSVSLSVCRISNCKLQHLRRSEGEKLMFCFAELESNITCEFSIVTRWRWIRNMSHDRRT